jgi:hypothetical protein
MSGSIFINYRRGEDSGFVQALLGRLESTFPADQLFIDVDSIEPGVDFVRVLEEQVARCDIFLTVIGKGWSEVRDETSARRLDNPEDFVRIEIASALAQNKRVIPVLLGDARMPRPDELPDELKSLTKRNGVRLTHDRFKADTADFIGALKKALATIDQEQTVQKARAGYEAGSSDKVSALRPHRSSPRDFVPVLVVGVFSSIFAFAVLGPKPWMTDFVSATRDYLVALSSKNADPVSKPPSAATNTNDVTFKPLEDGTLLGLGTSLEIAKAKYAHGEEETCAQDRFHDTAMHLRDNRSGTTLFFGGKWGAGLNLVLWEAPYAGPVMGVRIGDSRNEVERLLGEPDLSLGGGALYKRDNSLYRFDYDKSAVKRIWKSQYGQPLSLADTNRLGCE